MSTRSVASAASTRPASPGHDEYRPDPVRWKALAVVLAAGFMTLLDVSIVNVALPSIEQGLHAQPNELQWIVSGYALALGLLLVPSGRFGDAHGRRPVFMVGVALFVVASAACALAPTALALVFMRIVQGFAGGLISPQISGLIQSLFRGEERGKAFGFFGTTIGVSTAVGPLIGGALIALFGVHDGWRAVFFVNLPLGAAILLLARRYLPAPTAAERRPQALDPLGVVLLGAAVVCILVPLIEQRTWDSALRLALFPLAAALLVVWVLHERRYARTREPLVSLDLFRIRSYALGAPVGLLYFAGFIAVFFILTQYLQLGLNYPAWKSGLAATPFAIGGVLVASAGSRQVLRRGPKLLAFGLATFLVGMDGAAAVDRRPGRRARDLAQPDPHAVPGAGRARRECRRRAADRSADRHGRRHRGHRQHLLQPARVITRRLRVGLPPWHRQHRRVRRRRARAHARGCVHARPLSRDRGRVAARPTQQRA